MTQPPPYAPSAGTMPGGRAPGARSIGSLPPAQQGLIAQVLSVRCGPRSALLTPGSPVTVGRDPLAQLTVDDSRVSRAHLVLTALGANQVGVEDRSSNGTFLNGRRLDGHTGPGAPGAVLVAPFTLMIGAVDGYPLTVEAASSHNPIESSPFSTIMVRRPPSTAGPSAATGPSLPRRGAAPPTGPTPRPGYPGSSPSTAAWGAPSPAESSPLTAPMPSEQPFPPSGRRMADSTGPGQTGPSAPPVPTAPNVPTAPPGRMADQAPGTPSRPAGGTWTVGRDPNAAICIDDPLVSRAHAELRPAGDGFDVVDLRSSNGTWINSRRITRGHLGPGDRLTVGRTSLVCRDGQLSLVAPPRTTLAAHHISFALPTGKQLLDDVNFGLPAGSLVAVIGPSGAGKSTLLKALTGSQPATAGTVVYEGEDLYRNYDGLRGRIGVVPQDDLVHGRLTVRQALDYAARLRLPKDYTADQRNHEIDRVMGELSLAEHASTTVSRLSGGQRKRVSVALELLTQPSLLFLDEPTSGLDPNLDRSVMRLLRRQADTGRVVIVITHSVANLAACDKVMLLAPGGKIAYFGPPAELMAHFQMDDYADVFEAVTGEPDVWQQRFAGSPLAADAAPPEQNAQQGGGKARVRVSSAARQWRTLVSRQFRIMLTDRNFVLSSLMMPVLIALMALAVPGSAGFGPQGRDHPGEASTLLTILIIGASFMGVSASIRELIAERPIFLRERAVGLSQQMYLMSKVTVLLVLSVLQTVLLLGVVMIGKDGPGDGILMPGWPELGVAVFGTAFSSAVIGLLISALVSTSEQVMPAMVVAVMAQLVLCGGIIEVSGRTFMEILALPMPGRWGYAQAAGTIDLQKIRLDGPGAVKDRLWDHDLQSWLIGCGAVVAICLVAWVATALVLRRQKATA
ncbi:ATP-binding cassette domain-containing protein [Acidipropionibacterium virtanenii]|uniref:ABC transporter ATP-binding/permease protein n=1 Tax=Acidipropionibacterium virtanenii TaxID=2057246 RepID=A0A344UQ56_9ACTN|nr:ATP-binding cassette domain-containing protein [Acidipropionibacterium virtanenii]AXE37404.1 ABC transporter ATP-binding/permease protein [Acidipropionibacterium virtanenii]